MMFKNFLAAHPFFGRFEILMNLRGTDAIGAEPTTKTQNQGQTRARKALRYSAPLILLACTCCRTLPPLPQADFKEPGWTVREGQAIWTQPHHKAEIAGELLVATRAQGSGLFVQFSKNPFTLFVGRVAGNQWEVELPPQHRRYSGKGEPPRQLIWLYLPRVLEGQPPAQNWVWHQDTNGWRLENQATKESVEGVFTQ